MSALDVSDVVTLTTKALTLHEQGAYARAEAAAQALGARDCLVVTAPQLAQADCWALQSQSPLLAAAEKERMRHTAMAHILPAALATLARRRAAGTLLAGTCAPHEEAWECAFSQHATKLNMASGGPVVSRTLAAALGKFVGYRAYVRGARLVLARLVARVAPDAARDDVALACDALDLMAHPLRGGLVDAAFRFGEEVSLVSLVQQALVHYSGAANRDIDAGAQLRAAWARVERSGMLQVRNMADADAVSARTNARVAAVAAAAVAAKGLRVCALDSCGARELHASQFKLCGACKTVVYCSREHQAAHWRQHKAACKAARASAGGGAVPSDER
jgi:hypothetical protein